MALAALILVAVETSIEPSADLLRLAGDFRPPKSPVTAARLIAEGYKPGPALGAELRRREAAWIAAGCPAELPPGD